MTYLVYKHTSPSGKSYVGLTQNLEGRNKNHRNPNSKCKAFNAAIKKYGWDNFTHEILESSIPSLCEAQSAEIRLIAQHNSMWPNGYNLTEGGEGTEQTEASRANRMAAWERRTPEERAAITAKVLATKSSKVGLQQAAADKRLATFAAKSIEEKQAIKDKRAAKRASWTEEERAAFKQQLSKAARLREESKRQRW